MKNRLIIILCICSPIMLFHPQIIFAIWAPHHPIEVKLPDGSILTIKMHGDEFFNYATTLDNHLVSYGKDGYMYYSRFNSDGSLSIGNVRAHNAINRDNRELIYLQSHPITKYVNPDLYQIYKEKLTRNYSLKRQQTIHYKESEEKRYINIDKIDWGAEGSFPLEGHPKVLILLMEYEDLKFSIPNPKHSFEMMANQPGYSQNGGTGSIKDYFKYNSNGKFDPEFIVVGPIALEKKRGEYNGAIVDKMIKELLEKAIATEGINLKEFDNDNDGIVDNIFIYFAGHNRAESNEKDAIWPHRSSILASNISLNGVRLGNYTCSSELKGSSEKKDMCGIGTFCHEFSHVLGLPDFYDVNGMSEGFSAGLFSFSLMSRGNYNNNGNTPPSMNVVERNMLGWLDIEELDANTKDYELLPLSENKGYGITTNNPGEIFVLENRNMQNNWDKFIPSYDAGEGLLIYHLDRSENSINGMTAKERWDFNSVNNALEHQCLRIIPADGPENYKQGDYGKFMFFTGKEYKDYFVFTPWSKNETLSRIEKIRLLNNSVFFSYYDKIVLAEDIQISHPKIDLGILNSFQLKATIIPEDVENNNIIWNSSNERIARVDEQGLVTGISEGTAEIQATSGDGNASAHCTVNVTKSNIREFKEFITEQREARLSWNDTPTWKVWLVKWKKEGNKNYQQHECNNTFFIINHLEPNTNYEIEITTIINGKETTPILQKNFKTNALDGKFASIKGIKSDWKENDSYWPIVTNIQKDIRKIIWSIDGKEFPATRDLVLPLGKHLLKAKITTGDGVTETIIREINIKPQK